MDSVASLPPQVNGNIQGYLDVKIKELKWIQCTSTPIKIKILWWGQEDAADVFKLNSDNDKVLQTYEIKTSYKLFGAYLSNSEPLTLSVVDTKSGKTLGTCKIVNLSVILNETPYESSYPVINALGNTVAKLHVCFRLCMVASKQHAGSRHENGVKSKEVDGIKSLDRNVKTSRRKDAFGSSLRDLRDVRFDDETKSENNLVSNQFLEQVFQHGKELRKNLIENILENDPSNKRVYRLGSRADIESVQKDARKSNSQLFDYLTGADLNENDEKEVIEALRNDSPPSSIIAAASDLCYGAERPDAKRTIERPVPNAKDSDVSNGNESDVSSKSDSSEIDSSNKSLHSDTSFMRIADCLRIYVHSLRLNTAGWKKAASATPLQTLRLPTFYVEYSLPDVLSEKSNQPTSKINSGRPNFPDVRFCSKLVSDKCDTDIPFKKYSLHNVSNLHVINLNDVGIEFRIHSRSISRKGSSHIGSAKCTLGELTQSANFTNSQEIVIIDNTKPLVLGSIKVRIQLGCDRLHFGKDFIDAVSYSKKNRKLPRNDSMTKFCDGKTVKDTKSVDKEVESKKENRKPIDVKKNAADSRDEQHVHGRKIRERHTLELLQGLVHIPQVIFDTDVTNGSVYLMCRSFWREDSTVSKLCHHSQRALFNFRELIPILYNEDFLIRTKNNFLVVEVWHTSNDTNVLLGICKLPLHNFFIAYRDKEIAAHLFRRKFPVIGFDGWESIIDPLTGIIYGKLQAFIAIGTESQIQRVEFTRSDEAFTALTKELIPSKTRSESQLVEFRKPLVDANEKDTQRSFDVPFEKSTRYVNCSSQTELDGSQIESLQDNLLSSRSQTVSDKEVQCSVTVSRTTQTNISLIDSVQSEIEKVHFKMSSSENDVQNTLETDNNELTVDSSENRRDLFESFIECLTARLPTEIDIPKYHRTEMSKSFKTVNSSSDINIEENKSVPIKEDMQMNLPTRPTSLEGTDTRNSSPQVRNTMELLESLQSALSSVAPLPNLYPKLDNKATKEADNYVANKIEVAVPDPVESIPFKKQDSNYQRLFKIHVVIENAMHISVRRRRAKHKSKYTKRCEPQAPSTYVSFEPVQDKVLYTHVVPKSFAPCWNDHFETYVPINFLFDDQKRLIFKIWNKTSNDSNVPNPLIDTVIGFAAVDLTVLPVGLPSIQGWFNIMDFSGRCNGQIKIDVTPLENLSSIIASPNTKMPVTDQKISSLLDGPSSSLLSNALKRKFTELDEITERLKQRLLNVTHDDGDDLRDDFIVEFEHDLNTKCDESDESEFFYSQLNSDNKKVETISEPLGKSIENQESLNNNTDKLINSDNSISNNKSIAEIATDSSNNDQLESSTNEDGTAARFTLDLQKNRLNLDSLFQKLDMHTFAFNKNMFRNRNVQDSSEPKSNINTDSQPVISEEMSGDTSMCISSLDQKTDDSDEHIMDSDCVNNIVDDLRYRSELLWLRQAPEGAGNTSEDNIIIKN